MEYLFRATAIALGFFSTGLFVSLILSFWGG